MNNKPVAWMAVNGLNDSYSTFTNDQKQRLLPHISQCYSNWIPLYTHPHPDNLGLAESIIKQQQAEIEELKAKLQLHDAMDSQCASLMQQFRKASKK